MDKSLHREQWGHRRWGDHESVANLAVPPAVGLEAAAGPRVTAGRIAASARPVCAASTASDRRPRRLDGPSRQTLLPRPLLGTRQLPLPGLPPASRG